MLVNVSGRLFSTVLSAVSTALGAAALLVLTSPAAAQQLPGRRSPEQPQQAQGPAYLAGSWTFSWVGRESPVTQGPREGQVTFTASGTTLTVRGEGKVEDTGASYQESGTLEWNETRKSLAFKERLSGGIDISGTGDWTSPLAILYESQPVQAGGKSLRLKRTYSILSAQAFSVQEEMSIDGGPFVRLGSGRFVKVGQ